MVYGGGGGGGGCGGRRGGGEVAENRMLSVMTVLQPSLSRRVNK